MYEARAPSLLALNTQIVNFRRDFTASIDSKMHIPVHQVVVTFTPPDVAEVVDIRVLIWISTRSNIKLILCYPGALVLIAGSQSFSADALWWTMRFGVDTSSTIVMYIVLGVMNTRIT